MSAPRSPSAFSPRSRPRPTPPARLAAGDTEGQPNLAYRAKSRAEALGREAEHTKAAVAREAARTKKTLGREGKRAARRAKSVAHKATKTIEGALK